MTIAIIPSSSVPPGHQWAHSPSRESWSAAVVQVTGDLSSLSWPHEKHAQNSANVIHTLNILYSHNLCWITLFLGWVWRALSSCTLFLSQSSLLKVALASSSRRITLRMPGLLAGRLWRHWWISLMTGWSSRNWPHSLAPGTYTLRTGGSNGSVARMDCAAV